MLTQRAAVLLDTLERQVQQGLEEIVHLRRQLETLKAENSRLRDALRHCDATSAPHAASNCSENATEPDAEPASAVTATSSSHSVAGEAPSPHALLEEWYRRYPQTFFKGHTRPLKVGIDAELAKREPWSDKLIRRALACYVNLPRYLKAVRAGVERVGLDGQPAGRISEQEAHHARAKREALQARQRDKGRERAQATQENANLDHKLSELLAKHESR